MAFFHFNNIKVSGIAATVPDNVLETISFKPKFGDEEVDKFIAMTGVKQSHRTSEHQTASDLGYVAAKALLEKKGIKPEEIDCVVFSSHSPDYRRPSTPSSSSISQSGTKLLSVPVVLCSAILRMVALMSATLQRR